jgi:hypothetical protein
MTRAELDSNLRQAIASGTPVEITDPATNEVFYLLSAEQFKLLAGRYSPDTDPQQYYPLVDLTLAGDDALDPLLDSYQ